MQFITSGSNPIRAFLIFCKKLHYRWNNFHMFVSLVSRQAFFNYHYDDNDGDDADIFYANNERHRRHLRHNNQLLLKGGEMLWVTI